MSANKDNVGIRLIIFNLTKERGDKVVLYLAFPTLLGLKSHLAST
jgi:hypothetical protein